MPFREGNFGELIIDGPTQRGLEAVPDLHSRRLVPVGREKPMACTDDHRIAAIQLESDPSIAPGSIGFHLDGTERGEFDIDVELLDGSHERVIAVRLAPENGRE